MKKISFAIVAALIASSLAIAQAPTPTAQTGDAANGKKLFVTYLCWSCHGSSGRAGGAAPAITPSTRSAEDLIKYVRKPRGVMPPYTSKVLPDSELADIYAFVQSVAQPPKADSIPQLK